MLQGSSNVSSMRLLGYRPSASVAPAAPAVPVAAPAAPAASSRLMTHWSKATQDSLETIRTEAMQFLASIKLPEVLPQPVLQTFSALQEKIKAVVAPPAPKAPAKAPAASKPKPAAKKPASAADFKQMLGISNEKLAKVLDIPLDSARKNLPQIAKALHESGIRTKNGIIAALATIKTEVGSFQPIHEYGGPSYWARYNGRSDLGNRPGTNDGVTYHGRGYIQLTGRANYQTYGQKVGENLVSNPDRALNPKVAAEVLAEYFKSRDIPEMANEGDWRGVRRAVNGGYNGWDRFIAAVNKLKAAVK